MSGRLEGKTAIVTGGTKGIGRAIVERFLAEGASVVVTARSAPSVPFPKTCSLVFLSGDVAEAGHADAIVAETAKRFGALDILVNNAGLQLEKTVPDTSDDEWDRIFDVNVKSVFLFCRAALGQMTAAGRDQSSISDLTTDSSPIRALPPIAPPRAPSTPSPAP